MTLQARIVLEDCKFAFSELVDVLQGRRGKGGRKEFAKILPEIEGEELKRRRRIRWVNVLSLLRAIGHVLEG